MTRKQFISLIFVFAAVFSFTFGFNTTSISGPGPDDPPVWCYAIYDIEGQCCVDANGGTGELQEIPNPPLPSDWECRCTGLSREGQIWNPCECPLNCNAPD